MFLRRFKKLLSTKFEKSPYFFVLQNSKGRSLMVRRADKKTDYEAVDVLTKYAKHQLKLQKNDAFILVYHGKKMVKKIDLN